MVKLKYLFHFRVKYSAEKEFAGTFKEILQIFQHEVNNFQKFLCNHFPIRDKNVKMLDDDRIKYLFIYLGKHFSDRKLNYLFIYLFI